MGKYINLEKAAKAVSRLGDVAKTIAVLSGVIFSFAFLLSFKAGPLAFLGVVPTLVSLFLCYVLYLIGAGIQLFAETALAIKDIAIDNCVSANANLNNTYSNYSNLEHSNLEQQSSEHMNLKSQVRTDSVNQSSGPIGPLW